MKNRSVIQALTGLALLASAIGFGQYLAEKAQAQTGLGPNVYTITATGSAAMGAVAANPTRKALTICNGSAANTVTFTFGTAVTPVSLTTGQVLLTNSGANINCYSTPAAVQSNLGAQINFIASGGGTPVTVFEYY